MLVPETLERLLEQAIAKLNLTCEAPSQKESYRLFTANGGEIDDIELVRDDETLYLVASGVRFTGGMSTKVGPTDLPSCDSVRSKKDRKSSSNRKKTEKGSRNQV